MWRTLTAAFWARPNVAGLGAFPVNAVAVVCLGILGFANPGFWFLGLAGEAAYLAALGANPRFRRLVEAEDRARLAAEPAPETVRLLESLSDAGKRRLAALGQKCARILDLQRRGEAEDALLTGNADTLERLKTLYAKLLLARQNLESLDDGVTEAGLAQKLAALEKELADPGDTESVRASKTATAETLKKRLESLRRRGQTLEEIDSDLLRVESQVDLAVEKAAMDGKPLVLSSAVDLASNLLDGSSYTSSLGASLDLPGPPPAPRGRLKETE